MGEKSENIADDLVESPKLTRKIVKVHGRRIANQKAPRREKFLTRHKKGWLQS